MSYTSIIMDYINNYSHFLYSHSVNVARYSKAFAEIIRLNRGVGKLIEKRMGKESNVHKSELKYLSKKLDSKINNFFKL